jgi:RNA polymerase sigma-70 factor (ECF subfamily)
MRNLMRRCCGDATLADDLAQQVFLQAWRKIPDLRQPNRIGAWLRRLAVTTWLQHLRRNDALKDADLLDDAAGGVDADPADAAGIAMDLDRALTTLPHAVRLCIVLAYHDGLTQGEVADLIGLPLGTVKSHIRRGTRRLQVQLSAYDETSPTEAS